MTDLHPLREAVERIMDYQWSHSREAMTALQVLIDEADKAADEIERLRAWRDTVDDMLAVCHEIAGDDPRESINRLINWHVSVALDPAVSSDAAQLIADALAAIRGG
jgi:hypothetical protein